jgi:hypothetical protein
MITVAPFPIYLLDGIANPKMTSDSVEFSLRHLKVNLIPVDLSAHRINHITAAPTPPGRRGRNSATTVLQPRDDLRNAETQRALFDPLRHLAPHPVAALRAWIEAHTQHGIKPLRRETGG